MEGRGGDRGCARWGQGTLGMSSLHLEKKGMNTGNLEGKGGAEKQEGVEESREQEAGGQNSFSEPSGSRQGLKDKRSEPRRVSVLPLQWRITHSSRWIAQVLASELSLVAFALLLVMVFSKKWLDPSRSRFYQRWPTNVSAGIYTATHVMSMGLLEICRSNGCFHSENWKGETLPSPIPPPGLQSALVTVGHLMPLSPPSGHPQ